MNNSKDEIFLYPRQVRKDADYNMWFVFPGIESFALSSLGYLWLFRELDMLEDVDIERIYSDTKTTRIMRNKVDLIAFSLSFDMDFLEVFKTLEWCGFPFKSRERSDDIPLIFAGGPVVTSNPEPYRDIFDFFIIGEGESSPDGVSCYQFTQSDSGISNLDLSCGVNGRVVELCCKMKGRPKSEILKELAKFECVYVPGITDRVVKSTKKLAQCVYTPIISEKSFFSNTFILEVERGCANRCGFCLASYINLPIRFVPYEEIIDSIELGLKHTNKIALLGAQITAHPRFVDICKYIEDKIDNGHNIEMGISSLRVDSFTVPIVRSLVKAGQRNLTLAIEAGSERLRRVINKNLTEEQIYSAIDAAIECGLRGMKFYGMLGLPTETPDDVEELVNLAKRIKSKYKGFDLSFGFSTFVPKAATPFQWFGRDSEKSLETKSKYLQKELHKIGVQVSVSSPKWDYYQAVLSRGDSRLADYLIEVYKLGGKLGAFKKAAKNLKIDTDYYAISTYPYDKSLPWDFIEMRPGKDFLINESKRLVHTS
ncbi:MAG: B12-binding domain-containing radical SAM protein [Muribaculaceae bacterium]|nr:B12-binding domain-containing radical SAM protein [Muribaculaceae bacterium]